MSGKRGLSPGLFFFVSTLLISGVFALGLIDVVGTAGESWPPYPPVSDCATGTKINLPEVLPNPEVSFSEYWDMVKTPSLPLAVRRVFEKSFVGILVDKGKIISRGTGFVVKSREGLGVVTAFHVVGDLVCEPPRWVMKFTENPHVIKIHTGRGQFTAHIIRYDIDKDLALLGVDEENFGKGPVSVWGLPDGPIFAFGIYTSWQAIRIESTRAITFSGYDRVITARPLVGVLSGWVRHGFSGGCLIDSNGRCVGVVQSLALNGEKPETFYLPGVELAIFLQSK